MKADDVISAAWEEHRRYLLNIAYRLVGSFSDAEDMVQEAYTRLASADDAAIENIRGWLATVVTRLCLDHLRSARTRHEAGDGLWLPEALVSMAGLPADPADIVTLDESVRMALLIVLEELSPAERVVFVLHEVFEFTFEEIAPMVDRTPGACRQLASRARRRVQADAATPRKDVDLGEMRRLAKRFIAACEGGELQPLLEVLDPDVVGWADLGPTRVAPHQPSRGSQQVAKGALGFFGPTSGTRLALAEVNGDAGIIATRGGRTFAVMVMSVRDGLINAIYSIVDEKKLARVGRAI